MVKQLPRLLLLLALGLAASARADESCQDATEFTPRLCPTGLPAVRSVEVQVQGQASAGPAQPLVDCRHFRLTPALVRRYFERAQRVDDERGEHAVERGPCEAVGTLRFADGSRAQWRIEQVGTATVLREGATRPLTLLCTRCCFKPFAERAVR